MWYKVIYSQTYNLIELYLVMGMTFNRCSLLIQSLLYFQVGPMEIVVFEVSSQPAPAVRKALIILTQLNIYFCCVYFFLDYLLSFEWVLLWVQKYNWWTRTLSIHWIHSRLMPKFISDYTFCKNSFEQLSKYINNIIEKKQKMLSHSVC